MRATCCGCFELRSGGLFIIYTGLFFSVCWTILSLGVPTQTVSADPDDIDVFGIHGITQTSDGHRTYQRSRLDRTSLFVSGLASVAVHALCAYGIHKDRSSFMLLYLVLSWIEVGLMIASSVLLLFAVLFAFVIIAQAKSDDREMQKVAGYFGLPLAIWWIVITLCALTSLYFTMVLQRLYNYIKDTAHQALPTTNKGVVYRTG